MTPGSIRFPLPHGRGISLLLAIVLAATLPSVAQGKASDSAPDTLVLSNGDTLHGKLVKEVGGKVTFHSDALGDVDVPWEKVKELRSAEKFAVLAKTAKGHKKQAQIPIGSVEMTNQALTVQDQSAPAQTIPVKDAEYVVDAHTLDIQMNHEPNFFTGWNGAATAGATLVAATQNQYTVSGALSLMRTVPSVGWLATRHRTSADFSGSFGKITQPGYFSSGVFIPETTTKSTIYHVDGERDQYFSSHLFALAQLAYDHNFAQNLQLQQIYGAGMGWTLFNTPRHEADVKATLQYEKQTFIAAPSGANQNLIGSTFAANYMLRTKLVTYTQGVSYIPAYNTPRAYSANETNTFAFPTYKNLGFSVGTVDSYLNDPPLVVPATRRNSFQFTMGLTYAIKSKY